MLALSSNEKVQFFSKEDNSRHLDPPTNAMDTGQPVIFLTGQDVFIF